MSTLIIDSNGTHSWTQNGEFHKDDGPAVIWANGDEYWYHRGLPHREGGPAIIRANGTREWWRHGEWHRDDDLPAREDNHSKTWCQHNQYHRENGPAIMYNDGGQEWYYRGKRHRKGGFAIIWRTMGMLDLNRTYWWHGVCMSHTHSMWLVSTIESGLAQLRLPVYVLLWILQWIWPEIQVFEESKLVNFLQGRVNSRRRILAAKA